MPWVVKIDYGYLADPSRETGRYVPTRLRSNAVIPFGTSPNDAVAFDDRADADQAAALVSTNVTTIPAVAVVDLAAEMLIRGDGDAEQLRQAAKVANFAMAYSSPVATIQVTIDPSTGEGSGRCPGS